MTALEFGNICENIFKSKLNESEQHEFTFTRTIEDKKNLDSMLRGKNCNLIHNNSDIKKTCELINRVCDNHTNGGNRVGPFQFCTNISNIYNAL